MKVTWPAIALVAVLGGLAVALLTLTKLSSTEVLGIIGVLAGVGGGAALAQAKNDGVQSTVDAIQAETQQQTPMLDTIKRRVNGELDARIEAGAQAAADRAIAEVIQALRTEGVIRRG